MAKSQVNAQGEMQLVADWLSTLSPLWQSKTHVNVGKQQLQYAGQRLSAAQQRAFGVWNSWADARVATPTEVWIVEGKVVATGAAYGQVLDYVDEYAQSEDYQQFAPRAIVPVVLTMAVRQRTASRFARDGVRTVVYQPSFALVEALAKLFPAAQILQQGEGLIVE
jgi:hypothetical protein